MKNLSQGILTLIVSILFSSCGGSGSGSGSGSETKSISSELVDIWVISGSEGSDANVYFSVKGNGDVIQYNYSLDESNPGQFCYKANSNLTIKQTGQNSYKVESGNSVSDNWDITLNNDIVTVTYSNGNELTFQRSEVQESELKSKVCASTGNGNNRNLPSKVLGVWDATEDYPETNGKAYLLIKSDGSMAYYIYISAAAPAPTCYFLDDYGDILKHIQGNQYELTYGNGDGKFEVSISVNSNNMTYTWTDGPPTTYPRTDLQKSDLTPLCD